MKQKETRRHGEAATERRGDTEPCGCLDVSPPLPVSLSPSLPVAPSTRLLVSVSPRPRVPVSPCPPVPASPRPPLCALAGLVVALCVFAVGLNALAQTKRTGKVGSHSSRVVLSSEEREMVERAIGIICAERSKDPNGSVPIDEMQSRPSLPVHRPEAVAGAQRAQRLLPLAKNLVVGSLRELSVEYRLNDTRFFNVRLRQAISRVEAVKRVKPDADSRDNASVFLKSPHTITFGTIFLAGLPSDEGMISVLAHELVHIADGETDRLRPLFMTVGERASSLTGLRVRNQRAEELTCDLVGAMAARSFVSGDPSYEPLPRRLARAVEHNCVDEDDSDEDHLSPRNTIRALLALNPSLTRELIFGREDRIRSRTTRN